jgi:histidinol-phosphate aminotransferase
VVIDEAYIAFAGGDCSALAAEFDHVLLMRTLSKWGLAGLRLGFIQGPAAWMAEFEKLRLPYNINVLTQATVSFALEHAEVFDQQVKILISERDRLAPALAALPGTRVYPSAANFLLVRQSEAQAERVLVALRDGGIAVKNLSGGHPALQGCLRPSIGTPEQNQKMLEIWTRVATAAAR